MPLGTLRQVAGFEVAVDLHDLVGYNEHHYSHSRQFRSNIADEWKYWEKVRKVLDLPKTIKEETP